MSDSLIDINELEKFTGELSKEDLSNFVALVEDKLSSRYQLLIEACQSEDWKVARDLAHSLKSSSMLIGAKKLSSNSELFEHLYDEGQLEKLANESEVLLTLLAGVITEVKCLNKELNN